MESLTIRDSVAADIPALGEIAAATDLFPADMLEGMIRPYLNGEGHSWLTLAGPDGPAGFCYLEPERLTEGTWNMLALAIRPDLQGRGLGQRLVRAAEDGLRGAGARVMIVETAGTDDYALTRRFYEAQGYAQKGRIPDFYEDGVDKVIYWKRLRP